MTSLIGKEIVNPNCFVCNSKVGVTSRTSINIFGNDAVTHLNSPIINLLSSVLQIEINEKIVHSSVMCKKCYKTINEIDETENKLKQLKDDILTLFTNTTSKINKITTNGNEIIDQIENDIENDDMDHETLTTKNTDENNGLTDAKNIKNDASGNILPVSKLQLAFQANEIVVEEFTNENTIPHLQGVSNEDNECMDSQDIGTTEDIEKHVNEDNSQIEEVIIEKTQSIKKSKVDSALETIMRDGDSYKCLLCSEENRESQDAKSIMNHIKEFHDARVYICDLCGEFFKKRTELSQHYDDHVEREEGDFQCEVCNRIFSNLRLFRIHKRVHYQQAKTWSCEQCGKKYNSKNLLEEHTNTHTGNRPYVCEVCGKDFASKYSHRAHAKTHEARARPHECNQCSKTFLSQQNLTQHLKTHNGVKEFVCDTCGKAFGSSHNLEVHKIVHTGYKPFICNICGKAFARKAEIRDHERTHTGEKPYQCEFCGATFSQRSNLQSHKRATHYNDKRYKCDDCGKGFKRRRLLDYHTKAAHTGERPYKCETCSATFVYPEHFKKHMRIHTGEKPYLCEVCGKAFNSRDNRNAHRFIHSDKKPYECLVCGMGFMRKPLLYSHMQTQGHLNDTIVVNQPRLTSDDNIILQDNSLQLVMESTEDENSGVYVTELNDHIIIQDGGEQKIVRIAGGSISGANMNNVIVDREGEEDMEFNDGLIECKEEVDDSEGVYEYQDEDGNTIVLPAGSDIKQIIDPIDKSVKYVQISVADTVTDSKNWINIIQS
ncbi:zinc finger protein 431-like [Trichogramma pretiosum]|uniref:zinc finger protein 431-like n=1 Tax=Trichogramma pretiosum TaxID=7493 RepID=UPI0006C9610E|nr:zinc finger protein 431-like [Trichogramma pretiosum]XP_014223170.1 zinc finger protein 431-like [Trichogramma pretiosum]